MVTCKDNPNPNPNQLRRKSQQVMYSTMACLSVCLSVCLHLTFVRHFELSLNTHLFGALIRYSAMYTYLLTREINTNKGE